MTGAKILLKNLLRQSPLANPIFKRNLVKQYLQVLVLDFIYSHPPYNQLIFYGGSCLAQCYELPRLSEDLDFVDLTGKIDLNKLAHELVDYFQRQTELKVVFSLQKFRIYLKFPLLHELGLSVKSESDWLFLKLEIFSEFDFCQKYQIEIVPLFKYNQAILVKTFDLPTLMATKIRALLFRKWFKTNKTGKTLIKVKGRDYFDLMWYLQKNIKPNLKCLEKIADYPDLYQKLLQIIDKIDSRSIQLDLEAFISNPDFVKNLSHNLKNILKRELSAKISLR